MAEIESENIPEPLYVLVENGFIGAQLGANCLDIAFRRINTGNGQRRVSGNDPDDQEDNGRDNQYCKNQTPEAS